MFVTKMTIGNPANAFAEFMGTPAEPFPPFTAPVEFEFDERVNLFVGPNATGKSTLLAKLFERLAGGVEGIPAFCPWGMLDFAVSTRGVQAVRGTPGLFVGHSYEDPRPSFHYLIGTPLIAIPATRVPHISGKTVQRMFRDRTDRVIAGGFSQIFDGKDVIRAASDLQKEIEGLCKEEQDDLFDVYHNNHLDFPVADNPYSDLNVYFAEGTKYVSAADNFQNAINEAYLCAGEICSDIISGDSPQGDMIRNRVLSEAGLPTVVATLESGTRIKTVDPAQRKAEAEPLHIRQLSDGTQGTLWWIRLIAFALLKAADYQDRWAQTRATLFIDEIENHLHPTWQRRVIPALLEYFPGLQIFATTHSPFVVAGLRAGQVHLLNRDADGVITASTNTEDIVGWTADEILRTMMGVADPTDEATAAAARELRQLRDAGPSADERDEEQRQARMQKLRRMVDRDLLAGGPMAARRERFEQDFAAALEKHRQSQSLNQDGG